MIYPSMVRIRQQFNTTPIGDIPATVRREIEKLRLHTIIRPHANVAITAGSRGIANMSIVLAAVTKALRDLGAKPFIIPSMGSHGGATPEGQRKIIEQYGIKEETVGAPIRSTMEVVQVGSTSEGIPVFLDRHAHEADHIAIVNRVKPHTDFKAPIESGLMKMMAIGLANQHGADLYHRGFVQHGCYPVILSVAREILRRCPVAFGLAIVENQKDETALIRGVLPGGIEETERRLLRKAKRLLPRIPLDRIDLLIVDRIGKEISGTGMDTNVIGRNVIPFAQSAPRPKILRIFVRDLTPQTYGNAVGIGNADFTTKRLVEKIDREATYMNAITACTPETVRIPPYFESDRQAIDTAFKTLGLTEPQKARIVHIVDTLRLEEMEISEAMLDEAGQNSRVRVVGTPRPMAFDGDGNLVSDLTAK